MLSRISSPSSLFPLSSVNDVMNPLVTLSRLNESDVSQHFHVSTQIANSLVQFGSTLRHFQFSQRVMLIYVAFWQYEKGMEAEANRTLGKIKNRTGPSYNHDRRIVFWLFTNFQTSVTTHSHTHMQSLNPSFFFSTLLLSVVVVVVSHTFFLFSLSHCPCLSPSLSVSLHHSRNSLPHSLCITFSLSLSSSLSHCLSLFLSLSHFLLSLSFFLSLSLPLALSLSFFDSFIFLSLFSPLSQSSSLSFSCCSYHVVLIVVVVAVVICCSVIQLFFNIFSTQLDKKALASSTFFHLTKMSDILPSPPHAHSSLKLCKVKLPSLLSFNSKLTFQREKHYLFPPPQTHVHTQPFPLFSKH